MIRFPVWLHGQIVILFTQIRSTGRETDLELGKKEKTENMSVVWDVFEDILIQMRITSKQDVIDMIRSQTGSIHLKVLEHRQLLKPWVFTRSLQKIMWNKEMERHRKMVFYIIKLVTKSCSLVEVLKIQAKTALSDIV